MHFIYELNGLIETNTAGAHIKIEQSKFDNINTCGSIVRNKQIYLYQDTSMSRTTYTDWYRYTGMNYQYTLFTTNKYNY